MFKYLGQRLVSNVCTSVKGCLNAVIMTNNEYDSTFRQFLHPSLSSHTSMKLKLRLQRADVTLVRSTD